MIDKMKEQQVKTEGTGKDRTMHIYWAMGVVMLAFLAILTYRIVSGPMTSERDQWRTAFDKYKKVIRIQELPMRGNIYACDGRPVALAGESYRVHLDFSAAALALIHNDTLKMPQDSAKIKKRDESRKLLEHQMDLAAEQLAKFYNINTKPDRLRWQRMLKKKYNGTPLIERDITYPEWHKLSRQYPFVNYTGDPKTHKDDTVSLFRSTIINVYRNMRYVRVNPFDSLALRTIGDLYKEKQKGMSQAKYGLELKYDSLLRGKVGYSDRIKVAGSRINRVIDSVRHGYDLYTTLDMDKQYLLEKTMREQLMRLKAKRGTTVLMEVKTGKILAIVNLERDARGGYQEAGNYAFSDMSEPGSTIKVASMLVALNDGLVDPNEIVDVGNGIWPIHGSRVRDHNASKGGYGEITASQVIERSSNVGIAKLIMKHYGHRQEEFIQKMKALGFGLDLQSDIPGAARAYIPQPKVDGKPNPRWSAISMAWISHGYESKIPPIYTLAFFNAIANDGRYMRPYIVTDIKDKERNLVEHIDPQVLIEQIASPDALGKIREMMRRVVSEPRGTGAGLRSDIVSVSGKSGTAVLSHGDKGYSDESGHRSYQASFCGFFPSEAPKYSIIVVIREPSNEFPPAGGAMAAPVIKALAERLMSMETPRHLDLAQGGQRLSKHIAGGRKDVLTALTAKTALPHNAAPEVEPKDFIFVTSDGREQRIAPPQAGCVPALAGLSATDAAAWLSRLGYSATFVGYGHVVGQTPAPGVPLKRGQSVRVQLGL